MCHLSLTFYQKIINCMFYNNLDKVAKPSKIQLLFNPYEVLTHIPNKIMDLLTVQNDLSKRIFTLGRGTD